MALPTISSYSNSGAEEQIYGGRAVSLSKDTKVLAQQVKDLYRESENYRLAFSANWFLNVAFFMGFQNVTFSLSRRELTQISQAGTFMVVANRIMPAVRTFLANLIKNKPTINAIAPTDEVSDINAAVITEALMQYWYRTRNLQESYEEAALWAVICGTAFGKLFWNPSIGPSGTYVPLMLQEGEDVDYFGSGDMVKGVSLVPSGESTRFFRGDVDFLPVSPFEIHTVPHTVASWRQVRGVIHVSMKHVDWIADNYPNGKEVAPESNMTMGSFYQNRIRGMVSGDFADFIGAGNLSFEDHALVLEYREKKSRQYPQGRQVTVANGVVLEDKESPYADVFPEPIELGIVPFHCIQVPGRFWSIGLVEPLRPLQIEYNKVRTEIVKNRITVGRNKILAPIGSGIQPDDWANYHGIVIPYNNGYKPDVMPAVPLPAQTENEIQYNMRDMDDVSGVHEITRGINPNPVKSGLHANILLEADSTKLGPIIYGMERSIFRVNLGLIALAKKFYTDKRVIRIVGDDKQTQVYDFLGSDLTLDLELVPGSAFPRSRAAEQQTVVELWREGMFVDKNGRPDYRRALQLLQLGPVSAWVSDEDMDKRNQAWENSQFRNGIYVPARSFDDHIVHIEEVERYMKRPDFRVLTPQIQALYEYHRQEHANFLIQLASNAPSPTAYAPPPAAVSEAISRGKPNAGNPAGVLGTPGIQRPRDVVNRGGA